MRQSPTPPPAPAASAHVLVTGGTGFIGRHLVPLLLAQGSRVRVLTRSAEKVPASWQGRVEIAVGTIIDPLVLARAVHGMRIVHHLAGELRQQDLLYPTNVQGTRDLLDACLAAGVQTVVHYSTVGVMGTSHQGVVDESAPCRPENAYERSKLEAETLVLDMGRAAGVSVVVLRPSIVFGEGRAGGLAQWMRAIQRGRFRRIGRGGMANYIYAADVAGAALALAARPDASGRVFIVSDPCAMDDFVEMMAEALGVRISPDRIPRFIAFGAAYLLGGVGRIARVSPPLTVARVRALTQRVLYSSARLGAMGITPRVGVREGLQRTAAWFRAEGILV